MRKIAKYPMKQAGISWRAGLAIAAGAFFLGLTASAATAASPVVELAVAQTANWDTADAEYFLLTANVVHSDSIPGVEGVSRVTLSNGSQTRDALVRTVDAHKYRWAAIRDSYRYNVAAYRLDRMLGLGAVPVTVERKIDGVLASVTWWVEAEALPDDRADFADLPDEGADLAAFRQLVYMPFEGGTNRPSAISNADYTQAFALCDQLPNERNLAPVSGEFYRRLHALDRHELANQLGSLLSKHELGSLWARRHEILEHAGHALTRIPAADSEMAAN